MARVKIDNNEVEGEEGFVRQYADRFLAELPHQDYGKERQRILILLVLLSLFLIWPTLIMTGVSLRFDNKIIFGFAAGSVGLMVRNLIFMSSRIPEKPGKKLCWSYLAYLLFVVFSSLLIFGLLGLSDKISTRGLFYFFSLPLNFYVGLMAYSALDFLERILGKVFK